ncbi:hypothetical protein EQH57_0272, partial [Dictyocoela roeselum]
LNKVMLQESLYSFYCKHRRVPRAHDIMSSWETLEAALNNEDGYAKETRENENTREATFEFISATTGLRLQHKIALMTNLFEQDILKWVNKFKEIARICNWSEEARMEVLTQVISYEIQVKIGPKKHQNRYVWPYSI